MLRSHSSLLSSSIARFVQNTPFDTYYHDYSVTMLPMPPHHLLMPCTDVTLPLPTFDHIDFSCSVPMQPFHCPFTQAAQRVGDLRQNMGNAVEKKEAKLIISNLDLNVTDSDIKVIMDEKTKYRVSKKKPFQCTRKS